MKITLGVFLFLWITIMSGQNSEISPILFIYDASGSMWGQIDGKTKMNLASSVLTNTVNGLDANQKVGLVAYGHRNKSDCEDVEFLVDLDNLDKSIISNRLAEIKPLGKTPLAFSATLVIDKLKTNNKKATIILITDGIESCEGNLCRVIQDAKEAGIDFKLHIIGFGLKKDETESLECAAKAGNGKYFDASDSDGLTSVLQEATNYTVDDPSPNFQLLATKNGEPLDAYARIYKDGDANPMASLRTYRDTGEAYLPDGQFRIQVEALENTDLQPIIKNFQVKNGKSDIQHISFDAGSIKVTTTSNGEGWDAMVKVLDPVTNKVIGQTRTYGGMKEIQVPPGLYNITFEALRIKGESAKAHQNDIIVSGGQSNVIQHDFPSGLGYVGVKSGQELVDASVTFKSIPTQSSVATGRTYTSSSSNPKEFILSPGVYEVTVQALGKHKGFKQSFEMVILQGKSTEKTIQIK